MKDFMKRCGTATGRAVPSAWKTVRWLVPLTAAVSFAIMLLRQFGALACISNALAPLCRFVGLPGEAALAYVSAYFVNIYACIAAIDAIQLTDPRAVTLVAVMALCAHNVIAETAVQVRTGSSATRIVIIRTAASIGMAWLLNRLMPGGGPDVAAASASSDGSAAATAIQPWIPALTAWVLQTLRLLVRMSLLIFALTIIQALLAEFGVTKWLGRRLRPVMRLFGLRPDTAFLWIVANTLGLAYGAAIMIEECEQGRAPKEESDLFNHHIAVAHSNIEDLLLLVAAGGYFWWLLLSRWALALALVWERRLERRVCFKRAAAVLAALAIPCLCGCGRPYVEPNVLLITLDTTRADHIGCYAPHAGYTPNIDAIANDGTVFEQAYTVCPLTLPAHASIMTGVSPLRHGLHANDAGCLPPDIPTLAELFSTNGYDTAAFISAVVLDHGFGLARGFDTYDDRLPQRVLASVAASRQENHAAAWPSIDGAVTAGRFLEWIDAKSGAGSQKSETSESKPWFAWVHFYDPHGPYEPHPEFAAHGVEDPYSQEISYVDSLVGRIVSRLKSGKHYADTWIVIVGDHGESLGEHNEQHHGFTLYEGAIRIPLIVKPPRHPWKPRQTGVWRVPPRVSATVSCADIMATLSFGALAIAGPDTPGNPLQFANGAPPAPIYFESLYGAIAHDWAPVAGVRRGNWKYIESPRCELYDVEADPAESDNRAGPDDDIAESLAKDLEAFRSGDDARAGATAAATEIDPAMLARLRSLGYTAGGDSAKKAVEAARSAARQGDTRIDVKDALPLAEEVARYTAELAVGALDVAVTLPRIREIAALMPGHNKAQFLLSSALIAAGETDEAEAFLKRMIEEDADLTGAHGALGGLYLSQGRFPEARAEFEESLRLGGGPELQPLVDLRLAHIDLIEGDLHSATNRIIRARPLSNQRREASKRLGDALLRLGDIPSAIAAYDDALAELPGWAPAREGRIWAAIASDDPGLRMQAMREAYAMRLLSDRREPRDLEALAVAYAVNGKKDEALRTAREAIAIARGEIELPPPSPAYAAAMKKGALTDRGKYFGMVAARLEKAIPDWESGSVPDFEYVANRLAAPDYLSDTPIRQSAAPEY